MKTICSVRQMNEWAREQTLVRKTVGFIPTMGYLHDGHLSLVAKARSENDLVAVSIFVNPTQFGENEDFSAYPRDPEGDATKLENGGVDVLFMPDASDLYRADHETYIELERTSLPLCGKSRPGHFRGVATVVLKLLNIALPTKAYFGSKDYQQLQVIEKMVRDLNVSTLIVGCPTYREADGLAMSSRNSYLSLSQRKQAVCLFEALMIAKRLFNTREPDPRTYIQAMKERILTEPDADPDYINLTDPKTLENLTRVVDRALAVLAVRIGKTRLIDNMLLHE